MKERERLIRAKARGMKRDAEGKGKKILIKVWGEVIEEEVTGE